MHCTPKTLLTGVFGPLLRRSASLPPAYLLPSFTHVTTATFSSTSARQARARKPQPPKRKDNNPARGVSALRRTGLGKTQTLSVRLENLPKPVLDPARRRAVVTDPNHGLWDFFHQTPNNIAEEQELMSVLTPEQLAGHGRGWTQSELRNKDWDDLWRLWWVCVKERNRLATLEAELKKMAPAYGEHESRNRRDEIKKTMSRIRFVLTERWYAWEDARIAAMEDPDINLYADPKKNELVYEDKTATEIAGQAARQEVMERAEQEAQARDQDDVKSEDKREDELEARQEVERQAQEAYLQAKEEIRRPLLTAQLKAEAAQRQEGREERLRERARISLAVEAKIEARTQKELAAKARRDLRRKNRTKVATGSIGQVQGVGVMRDDSIAPSDHGKPVDNVSP